MPQLKAVLFDFDDTLLSHENDFPQFPGYYEPHIRNIYLYLKDTIPTLSWEIFFANYRSLREQMWEDPTITNQLVVLLQKLLEKHSIPVKPTRMGEILEAYDWDPISGAELFEEVHAVLKLLRQNNIQLALVTNTSEPMWMRDRELRAYGILEYFPDCRFASSEVGFEKPHPSMFTAPLECLNVDVDNAVFVGDNLQTDIIEGAWAVGMRAMWRYVPWKKEHNTEIASGRASELNVATIQNLNEMLPILDEWYPGWR